MEKMKIIMIIECHKVSVLELNENILITVMVMMHGEGDYDAEEYDYGGYNDDGAPILQLLKSQPSLSQTPSYLCRNNHVIIIIRYHDHEHEESSLRTFHRTCYYSPQDVVMSSSSSFSSSYIYQHHHHNKYGHLSPDLLSPQGVPSQRS